MDKIWLFKLEKGKVMKYKKLKRAFALTVAVLMAVPTVNYGGMAEVHAEEAFDGSSEVTEEPEEASDPILEPQEEKTADTSEDVVVLESDEETSADLEMDEKTPADPEVDEETPADPETDTEDSKDEVKNQEIKQEESEEKSDEKIDDEIDVIQGDPETDNEIIIESGENTSPLFSAAENSEDPESGIQLQFTGNAADAYTVDKSGWSNSAYTITAKEGYALREVGSSESKNSLLADIKDGEEAEGTYSFYVIDEATHEESDLQSINYKIDRKAPTGTIRCLNKTWSEYSYGTLQPVLSVVVGTVVVKIDAEDAGSGIQSIKYGIAPLLYNKNQVDLMVRVNDDGPEDGWHVYDASTGIVLKPNSQNVVYARITDNSGNETLICSTTIMTNNAGDMVYPDGDADQKDGTVINPSQPGNTDQGTSTPSQPEGTDQGTSTPSQPESTDQGTSTPSQPELNVSVSGIKAQTYTGKAITPKIVVKDNATKKKLKQGKQYTGSYENNVNAGTGTIVLTGINGYEGVKRVDFTIQPQNIAKKIKAKVNGKKFRYAGTALTPGVTVTYGKMVLVEGTDYEISYADNNSKGTAKIYLKGNGNYTGTRTVKFKITGPQMKEAEVTLSASSAVYGSADSRPGVTAVYNGKTLTEGTDYTVKYPKTWKPGKNMITIQGKGSFSGSVKRAFTIEKAPMDKVTVSAKSTWQATGKKLSIVPDSVTLNGAALVLNKDYTVKYRSTSTGKAVSAVKTTGAYQMVLTGKGCYQGTKTVDFTVTDGTAVDNTNPTAPATTPETKPEAKPETKPETTVTGVGAVVDGLQLVESDIEGTFSTGDHIGQKVKLTATLSELENREESLKAFEQEVPWMMDVEECTDTDLSHYDIHCVATNIEGITDATQFTLKLKIDGVTKDSVVYGLNKYNNDDYDGLLGITCYDGYVAVRSSYKHFFNPKEIYIMVKK